MPDDLAAQIPLDPPRRRRVALPRAQHRRGRGGRRHRARLIAAYADVELDCRHRDQRQGSHAARRTQRAAVGHDARPLDRRRPRCEARFGVAPEQVVDVMALMGDSIDNIPGVKRHRREDRGRARSRRSATSRACSTDSTRWSSSSLRGAKKVAEPPARARRTTARLEPAAGVVRRDVPVDLHAGGSARRAARRRAARALFTELGFQSLLRQLAARRRRSPSRPPLIETPRRPSSTSPRARAGGWLALATVCDAGPPATTAGARADRRAPAAAPPVRLPLAPTRRCAAARAGLARTRAFEVIGHDLKRDLLQLTARGCRCSAARCSTS